MRLLVTGSSGQLALSLHELCRSNAVHLMRLGRPDLDLTFTTTIERAIADVSPAVVINAAAYTAVDQAEREPTLAMQINAEGAGAVAAACQRLDIPIIHISTDYVFDGLKREPYTEVDATAPATAYGRSKLAGEHCVAAAAPRHVILRTSWLHSPFGSNFVKTMLRLSGTMPEIRVVNDQVGNPTYAPHLAEAVLAIATRISDAPSSHSLWGTYHASGSGAATWYDFAQEIFRQSHLLGRPKVTLRAIGSSDFSTLAKRPANSRLDCSRLDKTFGVRLPRWETGIEEGVEQLLCATA